MPEIETETTERDLVEEAEELSMTIPTASDGCTIILHPNDDGTYHWMCPNCKREDLGLSAETNLDDYLPNVTCPNCGFQFGVDKRYLSASYICKECLTTQRFDGACGNCGARATRRASIPVPLASSRDIVEEVEELLAKATPGPWSHYYGKLRPQFSVMIDEIHGARGEVVVAWPGFDGLHKSTAFDNAELIAAAPELLRRLVEEVKRLRKQQKAHAEMIDDYYGSR